MRSPQPLPGICRSARAGSFFKNAPWYVNGPLGGWTLSGVARIVSGNPYQPFLTDPNLLGGAGFNRVVRPDIVPGVPLKNPLWDPGCRVGTRSWDQ